MKKEILVFISEDFADWESAYVCSVLNKPVGDFVVKTLAVDKNPVKSMGGFTVLPDYSINELPASFHMLILVGGTGWMKSPETDLKSVVDLCVEKGIPVAAICGAGIFLAEHGFLDNIKHTGNSSAFLEQFAPNYKGATNFLEKQAVSDGGFITANGTSALEFSREIFKLLKVMPEEEAEAWFQMFKVGYYKE